MAKNEITKIIVFGATGKTGCQVVRYALEKGFKITILVRDKSRVTLKYHNLTIIKGDVRNKKDVDKAIKDQDIVISSLGVKPGQTPVCKVAIENILESMKKFKIKKLVAVSGYGARETAVGFYGKLLYFLMKDLMLDKNEMEDLIEQSKIDWTVIRPVILTNANYTDKYNLITEGTLTGVHFISREDTARFIIDSLDKNNYKHKFVTIYN